MKKIFLICPVRAVTDKQKEDLLQYVLEQEKINNIIYYPARDTDQDDDIGYRICIDNKEALKLADEVHIMYDPSSKGSLFDLGMAFMANKPLKIINFNDIKQTPTKSFSNMIKEWDEKSNKKGKKL